MKRVFLLCCALLSVASVQAQELACDHKFNGNDGPGGFLFKNSDHSGSVLLLPDWLPPCDSVTLFRRRPACRRPNKDCAVVRKLERLRYTGIANGNRQHWRSDKLIKRLIRRSNRGFNNKRGRGFVFQCVYETGDNLCWNLRRVDEERND